jgi:hypothetical protein
MISFQCLSVVQFVRMAGIIGGIVERARENIWGAG